MATACSSILQGLNPIQLYQDATGNPPDPWQADVLLTTHKRRLLNWGRQVGKTTVVGALVAHMVTTRPGSLSIILAPRQEQATELFRGTRTMLRNLDLVSGPDSDRETRLEMPDGTRVRAEPCTEANVRGFAGVDLLIFEEASRVPDGLYMAADPFIATNPDAIEVALSTPNGKRGWFATEWDGDMDLVDEVGPQRWKREDADWFRSRVPSACCSRITAEYLESRRKKWGDMIYRQEFECAFLDAERAAFSSEDIEGAQDGTHEHWQAFKTWED